MYCVGFMFCSSQMHSVFFVLHLLALVMLSLGYRRASLSRFFSRKLCKFSTVVDLPTNADQELVKTRHSAAHVMAMAVQNLFPGTKIATGPWTDSGFFYDFFVPEHKGILPEQLPAIRKEMEKIVKRDYPITREEVSHEEARLRLAAAGETFKLEILDKIDPSATISIYHIGDKWWDLCAGPHVNKTGQIPLTALELSSVSGAYWKGDDKNPMLQRIHGTSWLTKDQLEFFKFQQSEARRRDHRQIGRDLDLFSIQEEAGSGIVFWHPKGSVVRRAIEDFWKDEHLKNGYSLLNTPHIANLSLWKTSGHCDFYKNDMFQPISVDDEQYQLKPMNCPFHCLIYKNSPRSYKDLPLRWAELGTVYRYEKSGTLHGLFRVRGFTQDDAHIFCLPSQLEDEIVRVLDLTEKFLHTFGFENFDIMLSTRPKDSVGTTIIWDKATEALRNALIRKNWPYTIDEGGGAFYGPKIDVKICDAIGRKWQCSTIQCDFNLPERFDLTYKDRDQSDQRPIMVHRAIFGSLERFFGILIENSAGDFPLWISPVQLRLLPVVDSAVGFCEEIQRAAQLSGIRVEIDNSGNRIGKMIRTSEQDKIPIVGVVGNKEVSDKTISIRIRKEGEIGQILVDQLLLSMHEVIKDRGELKDVIAKLRT